MVDVNVLHLFDENHELLLRNLKSFTAHKIFSKKKFIVNPEDSKSLCISAVNNRRVMLPNGATPSEFALRYSQHLKKLLTRYEQTHSTMPEVIIKVKGAINVCYLITY